MINTKTTIFIISIISLIFLFFYIFNVPLFLPAFFFKTNYILILPRYILYKNKEELFLNSFKNINLKEVNIDNLSLSMLNKIDTQLIFKILKEKKALLIPTYNGFINLKNDEIKNEQELKNIFLVFIKNYFYNKNSKLKNLPFIYLINYYLNIIFPLSITEDSFLFLKNFPFFNKFVLITPYFITTEEKNYLNKICEEFRKYILINYLFSIKDTNNKNINKPFFQFIKYQSFLDNISYSYNFINKKIDINLYFSKNWISYILNINNNFNPSNFLFFILIYPDNKSEINNNTALYKLKITLENIIKNNYKIKTPISAMYKNLLIKIQLIDIKNVKPLYYMVFKIYLPQKSKNNSLLITESDKKNFFDSYISMDRITPEKILQKDLVSYNLIIFDGINIRKINESTSKTLYSLYQNGILSFLFITDGKFIGKKDDNPLIEKIIPVILKARSLKYLPPIKITLFLDISSSMLGEKLSLAKVSLLEFIKNLKDNDLITIVIFWDKYKILFKNLLKNEIVKTLKIQKIKARGGTDLFTPLSKIIDDFSISDNKERHIIIISDGFTKDENFNNLIYKARLKNITITTIGIGKKINFDLLSKLSSSTGGNFYQVNSFEAIPSIILEDRKKISRSNFAKKKFNIYDFNNDYVSFIGGMNLYTPKLQSFTIFQNKYNDPLLIYKKYKNRFQILFSSDIYGYYTSTFFKNNYVQNSFLNILNNINKDRNITINISEHFKGITITFKKNFLYSPEIIIYQENKIIKKVKLKKMLFDYYSKNIFFNKEGLYFIVITDKNENIAKFKYYFNNSFSGIIKSSFYNYLNNNSKKFILLYNSDYWLILFLIFSLLLTIINRKSRFNN